MYYCIRHKYLAVYLKDCVPFSAVENKAQLAGLYAGWKLVFRLPITAVD